MSNLFVLLIGFITLLIGLLCFNQDFMWKWHIADKRSAGFSEKSLERTKSWEQLNIFRGCFFTLLGLFIIVLVLLGWIHPR